MTVMTLVATPDPDPRDVHLYDPQAFIPYPADVERTMLGELRQAINPSRVVPTWEQTQRQTVAEYDPQAFIALLRAEAQP